jgi:hypothetical protein
MNGAAHADAPAGNAQLDAITDSRATNAGCLLGRGLCPYRFHALRHTSKKSIPVRRDTCVVPRRQARQRHAGEVPSTGRLFLTGGGEVEGRQVIDRRECCGRRLTGQRLKGAHSARMAPAPSEPKVTLSSPDPVVHRPFGLFAAASDPLVLAQVAHPVTSQKGSGQGRVWRRRAMPQTHGTRQHQGSRDAAIPDLGRRPSPAQPIPALQGTPDRWQLKVIARLRFRTTPACGSPREASW